MPASSPGSSSRRIVGHCSFRAYEQRHSVVVVHEPVVAVYVPALVQVLKSLHRSALALVICSTWDVRQRSLSTPLPRQSTLNRLNLGSRRAKTTSPSPSSSSSSSSPSMRNVPSSSRRVGSVPAPEKSTMRRCGSSSSMAAMRGASSSSSSP